MTERWYQEKKREGFYRRAKREGYRARSAYKLQQIQEKFRLIRKGDTVVDLGASPGGWSQVAVGLVGEGGRVFGLDLASVRAVEGAVFLRGDLTKPETMEALRREMARNGPALANVVVSDMSPDISGNYMRDQAESMWLCQKAFEFAEQVLDRGGNFVAKIFEGEDYPEFKKTLEARFEMVKPYRPEATRKASSEVYLVAKGYRGRPPPTVGTA
jgi:23S rRNA (uridine2552-2'-O)-methyltransferase